jgi:hypothetical protein
VVSRAKEANVGLDPMAREVIGGARAEADKSAAELVLGRTRVRRRRQGRERPTGELLGGIRVAEDDGVMEHACRGRTREGRGEHERRGDW